MARSLVDVEAQILISPSQALRHLSHPYSLALVVADMMANSGDSAGNLEEGDQSAPAQWAGQSAFTSIDETLEFIRLGGRVSEGAKEGTQSGAREALGFLVLKPQVRYKNSVVIGDATGAPNGDARFDIIRWKPIQGDSWERVLSRRKPAITRIRHRAENPNRAVKIQTENSFVKNQQLLFIIDWLGIARDQRANNPASYRIAFGGGSWSIVWRQNQPPCLEKWVNGKWSAYARFDSVPPSTYEGSVVVKLRRIAGQLVVSFNEKSFDVQGLDSVLDADAPHSPTEFVIPAGRVLVSSYGVSATVGLGTIDYQTSTKKGLTGKASGEQAHNFKIPAATTKGKTGGWAAGTANTKVTAESDGHGKILWECTLTGNAIDTPAVSTIFAEFEPTTEENPVEPLDIRAACNSIKWSSAEPGLLATNEIRIDCSRNLLDKLAREQGIDWQDYIQPFRPVTIKTRRVYMEDGGGFSYSDWKYWPDTYIFTYDKATPGYNQRKFTLICRDDIVRLQPPAGFVDERYAPLDSQYALGGKSQIFGVDGIKYFLKTTISPDMATRLNGGAGREFAYQSSRYPLLDFRTGRVGILPFLQPPSQARFQLPITFGGNIFSEFLKMCEYDHAVFYFGFPPGFETERSCPIYGRIIDIVSAYGDTPVELVDGEYGGIDDAGKGILSAQLRFMSEKAFNVVRTWSGRLGGVAGQLVPAVYRGYDRLPTGDPGAQEESWERVLLIQKDLFSQFPSLVQAISTLSMREFEGIVLEDSQFTVPYDEGLRWGMKVKPKMNQPIHSDDSLNLHDKTLRVKRADHTIDFVRKGGLPWRTELTCRPLSASGF
jgi:hypothetical protein